MRYNFLSISSIAYLTLTFHPIVIGILANGLKSCSFLSCDCDICVISGILVVPLLFILGGSPLEKREVVILISANVSHIGPTF